MNSLLERLGRFSARRHWIVIIAWLVILGGTLWARHASGGEFVNNYTGPAAAPRSAWTG
jgi:putative drug exporter of the RND superfamily